jgi:ammonia channel protein AmtB
VSARSVNFSALCIFITLWHLVVYCPIAHMVWHPAGILRMWGVLDFAGEPQATTPAAGACMLYDAVQVLVSESGALRRTSLCCTHALTHLAGWHGCAPC